MCPIAHICSTNRSIITWLTKAMSLSIISIFCSSEQLFQPVKYLLIKQHWSAAPNASFWDWLLKCNIYSRPSLVNLNVNRPLIQKCLHLEPFKFMMKLWFNNYRRAKVLTTFYAGVKALRLSCDYWIRYKS